MKKYDYGAESQGVEGSAPAEQFAKNYAGENSEGILSKEYGYTLRWPADAGEDPRKTSFDEFHSSTNEYSHDETADASDRIERPLMDEVEEDFLRSGSAPEMAGTASRHSVAKAASPSEKSEDE